MREEMCADCGAPVEIVDGRPTNGIVIWGNPSEVICGACAERLAWYMDVRDA